VSAATFTHPATHVCHPAGHVVVHTPFTQLPAVQALPHVPQFQGLSDKSAHQPLHEVMPAAHVGLHCSSEQTCPVAHVFPQAPQSSGDVVVSQRSPQTTSSGLHPRNVHAPFWHRSIGAHALPHASQLSWLFARSVQTPAHVVRPFGHEPGSTIPAASTPGSTPPSSLGTPFTAAPPHAARPIEIESKKAELLMAERISKNGAAVVPIPPPDGGTPDPKATPIAPGFASSERAY
jgi:hypothetical protein